MQLLLLAELLKKRSAEQPAVHAAPAAKPVPCA
jgi:hypothetical protein